MSEYISKTFGVRRYVGAGEGRDVKYTASAKPALGLYNGIEVEVNATGPVANKGTGFDGTQAYVPAGSKIEYAHLKLRKVADGNLTFKLVGKAGNVLGSFDAVAVLAADAKRDADGSVIVAAYDVDGEGVIGKVFGEDAYVVAEGLAAGIEGILLVDFI